MERLLEASVADTDSAPGERGSTPSQDGDGAKDRKMERGVYFPEQKDGRIRSGKSVTLGGPRSPDEPLQAVLNGKVIPNPDQGDEKVWCRHFAQAYVQAEGGKPGNLFERFSSEEGIRRAFEGESLAVTSEDHLRFLREAGPEEKQLLGGNQLGIYMKRLAIKLREDAGANGGAERSEVRCLLCTADHAMALQVQRKHSEVDGEYFAFRVYDPNITGNAARLVVPDLERLGEIDLHDMLMVVKDDERPVDVPHDVYGNRNTPLVAYCRDPAMAGRVERLTPDVSSENIHLAMQCGSTLDFQAMVGNAGSGAGERFSDFMYTEHGYRTLRGVSGLHLALAKNHFDVIGMYLDQALDSGQDPAGMEKLLRSKPESYPNTAFDSAMIIDSPTVVGMFMDSFDKAARAGSVDLYQVLGASSLRKGLRAGSTLAVNEFVEKIKQVPDRSLSVDRKKELLGTSGLEEAVRDNDKQAMANIVTTIGSSNALTEVEKFELMGQSGLQAAFREGDVDSADRVYKTVLFNRGLDPERKQDVLCSSGLSEALREGDVSLVNRIFKTASSCRAGPLFKSLWLQQSGLERALEEGDCAAVLRIVETIEAASLTPDQKGALKDASDLSLVRELGDADAVRRITDTINSGELDGLDDRLKTDWLAHLAPAPAPSRAPSDNAGAR